MLCNQTCAFKVRNSGAEKTNTSLSLNYRLSLQNNKQSRETHLQQDLSWLMTEHLTGRPWPSWGGFHLCWLLWLPHPVHIRFRKRKEFASRASLFILFSNLALFHWGMCVQKLPQLTLLPVGQFKPETNPLWKCTVCCVETESGSDFEIEVSELTTKMYGKI